MRRKEVSREQWNKECVAGTNTLVKNAAAAGKSTLKKKTAKTAKKKKGVSK